MTGSVIAINTDREMTAMFQLVSVHKRGFFSKIEEGDKNNHRHMSDIPRIIF
jgi:hypothetical protein